MDVYRELGERLRGMKQTAPILYQGVVKSVEGSTCTVEIDGLDIPDVRLRASTTSDDLELLITPAIGSAVIIGSLSGDLTQLAVLSVDRAETIVIGGGQQGGLVLVHELVQKLNALESDLNTLKKAVQRAVIVPQDGGASFRTSLLSWAGQQLPKTTAQQIANPNVKQ